MHCCWVLPSCLCSRCCVQADDYEEGEYGEAASAVFSATQALAQHCSAGWAFPWGLRARLAELLLRGQFDTLDEGQYTDCRQELLGLLQASAGAQPLPLRSRGSNRLPSGAAGPAAGWWRCCWCRRRCRRRCRCFPTALLLLLLHHAVETRPLLIPAPRGPLLRCPFLPAGRCVEGAGHQRGRAQRCVRLGALPAGTCSLLGGGRRTRHGGAWSRRGFRAGCAAIAGCADVASL